jgi:UDP-glucose 4-epimerase
VTGGAGYIGSHIADTFLSHGKKIVIFDSLYRGLESRIDYLRHKHKCDIPFILGDIRDVKKVEEALSEYQPHGIIHTAALKAVGESIEKRDEYFEVNFTATSLLLECALRNSIKNFIFSSTAAVYGAPEHSNPIKESDEKRPISPYGASKLAAENKVSEFLAIHGNRGSSLRFFNVVGAASPELLDNSVENLVPIVIKKLKNQEQPVIYGTDYSTKDGTCVRDYVDVRDIARAHLAVADYRGILPKALNVGTGNGGSVREVIELVCDASGLNQVVPKTEIRRSGDPAFLCANPGLIKNVLGYTAEFSLESSIKSLFSNTMRETR